MSQVSPPLRIALVAAIAFAAIWALVIRPQPEPPVTQDPAAVETAATAAGADANRSATSADPSAAAAAATNANASVAAAEAAADGLPGEAAVTAAGSTPADASPAPPVELNRPALARLPADVASAVRQDKVLAILFWNSRAPEDRRVRRALRDANSHGKRVFVRAAPVSDISRYAPITRGVDVAQSPTLVVVDSDLRAEALVGYVARTTIRQALSDAIRAGSAAKAAR